MATFDDLTANSRWIVVSLRRPSSSSTTIKVSHASLHAHCLNVSFSHHIDLTALCSSTEHSHFPFVFEKEPWERLSPALLLHRSSCDGFRPVHSF